MRRHAATVLLSDEKPSNKLTPRSFLTMRDRDKKNRLDRLNRLVSELQQGGKFDTLRRLRNKRNHVAKYFDRLSVRKLAEMSDGHLLVVGYPKGIKHRNFKGNGKKKLRKLDLLELQPNHKICRGGESGERASNSRRG